MSDYEEKVHHMYPDAHVPNDDVTIILEPSTPQPNPLVELRERCEITHGQFIASSDEAFIDRDEDAELYFTGKAAGMFAAIQMIKQALRDG